MRYGVLDTPIYTALMREQARREAAAYVRTLASVCPTCGVTVGLPCRTSSGRVTVHHKARRW